MQKQAFNTVTLPSNILQTEKHNKVNCLPAAIDSQSKIKKYLAFQLEQYKEM